MTRGEQDIILISQQGKGIRFNEEEVRPMGRAAAGVNAMRLDPWDALAGADVASDDADLLVITQKGYGKRTPLTEYRRCLLYTSIEAVAGVHRSVQTRLLLTFRRPG